MLSQREMGLVLGRTGKFIVRMMKEQLDGTTRWLVLKDAAGRMPRFDSQAEAQKVAAELNLKNGGVPQGRPFARFWVEPEGPSSTIEWEA